MCSSGMQEMWTYVPPGTTVIFLVNHTSVQVSKEKKIYLGI